MWYLSRGPIIIHTSLALFEAISINSYLLDYFLSIFVVLLVDVTENKLANTIMYSPDREL